MNNFLERSKILQANSSQLDQSVKEISKLYIDSIKNGGKLIFAGNGGSAAEAQHMSAEFVGTLVKSNFRRAFKSISLTTDTSFLTAWSNDFGFEDIFKRQLEGLAEHNDCFIAYSTSGNSDNIISALEYTKSVSITSVLFSGKDKSKCSELADYTFHAPSKNTALIQEIHTMVGHEVCSIIDNSKL